MSWDNSQRFWAEQRSWFNDFVSQQKKANTTSSRLLEHKRDLWEKRKTYYLRSRKSLQAMHGGSIKIEVDQESISEPLGALLNAVAPSLQKSFDTHFGDLARNALEKWPVYTGVSKSLLVLAYVMEGDGIFTAKLYSRAPYTVYIEGQPHRQLIFVPAEAVADKIAADTLDLLRKV